LSSADIGSEKIASSLVSAAPLYAVSFAFVGSVSGDASLGLAVGGACLS
jgi:hypothetical protein